MGSGLGLSQAAGVRGEEKKGKEEEDSSNLPKTSQDARNLMILPQNL